MDWVIAVLSAILVGVVLKKAYNEHYRDGFIKTDSSVGDSQLYLMLALSYKSGELIDGLSKDYTLAESYVYRAITEITGSNGVVEKWPYKWTDRLEAVYRINGSSFVYDAILGKIDVSALEDEAYLIGYWGDTEYALVQVAKSLEEVIKLAEDHLGGDIELKYNEEFEQWEGRLGNLLVVVKLRPAGTLKFLAAFSGWTYKTKSYYLLWVRVLERIEDFVFGLIRPKKVVNQKKEQNHDDETTVKVGDNEYPKWAVDRAKEIVEKHGGRLESAIAAVVLLAEADKNATHADPNEPGMGFSHHIGGYVVPKSEKEE